MDNKSYEEILKELETSKKIIHELKDTITTNEESNKKLIKNERFLSQCALELAEINPEENIHEFTALKMGIIFPDSIILVTSYDQKTDLFGLASVQGLKPNHLEILTRFMGKNFMDMKVRFKDFDELLQKCLFTRTFKELKRGFYAATGQIFPQKLCKLIEKMLGVKKTYGMGLMWDGRLYGAVSVFSRGETVLDKKDMVETLIHMVSVALQRQSAEIEIKRALDEKELLLKEIHHRTKNNLAILSSLLNLQSIYVTDQDAQKILKESHNRAKCMALIHEKLYNSQDLKNIDLGEYLRTLTRNLFYSYLHESQYIKLNLNIEDTPLDVDTAIPLGLMVNELITNSIKYAFPDGNRGEISLEFYSDNDEFILGISDNGVGLPDNFDFENTDSLGLQIVSRLVGQINGEMEMNNSNGTEFRISFRENQY